MTFEVKDEALRQAAGEGMDAFISVIVDAIKQGVGGELSAEQARLSKALQGT